MASCEICGKEFEKRVYLNRGNRPQVATGQKYCSAECRSESMDRRMEGDKFVVFNRDGCRCQYCGASPAEDDVRLVCDHITPYSRGGSDTADNLVTACYRCNASKSSNPLSEDSESLIRGVVSDRNERQGIHPKKPIKGSHCRESVPRS